jgi:hypothetical protein
VGAAFSTRTVQLAAATAQAEYFLGLLEGRKREVCELLESQLDDLTRLQRKGCLVAIRRKRRIVKELEAEVRTVDRMLVALRVRLGLPTLRRTL